jgi:hypothetical protein
MRFFKPPSTVDVYHILMASETGQLACFLIFSRIFGDLRINLNRAGELVKKVKNFN